VETLELDGDATVGLLRVIMEERSGLCAKRQEYLSAYPPVRTVITAATGTTEDDATPLWSVASSGDQLILKEAGSSTEVRQGKAASEGGAFVARLAPDDAQRCSAVRRTVPGDNSCAFHAAAYVLEARSRTLGPALRGKIADVVRGHPAVFTRDYLGMPNDAYCRRLNSPDFWGGALELGILSFVYEVEIRSFDVARMARVDRYGAKEGYARCVYLLYTDGNHYDALALAPYGGAPESTDRVLFNSKDDLAMAKFRNLAESLFRKQSK
jgi:ubiquitin thioesterase OTU1